MHGSFIKKNSADGRETSLDEACIVNGLSLTLARTLLDCRTLQYLDLLLIQKTTQKTLKTRLSFFHCMCVCM